MKIRYFDNSATTSVKEEVIKEMLPYFKEKFGNPSSAYTIGRESKRVIEDARIKVARLINCNPNEIYFTCGGSESNNMIIKGIAYANKTKGNHIITTKIEHPSVLNTCKTLKKHGFEITYLNVNEEGFIDLNELRNSIKNNTILISIMFANNEIGTIQPIYEISRIAKMYNIIFHTDSVQACGNVQIDVKRMGIDCLSMSGHKIYGPKGVGAAYIRNGINIEKLIDGGHQEKDKRAGTENVPGIIGLGKACELSRINLYEHINYLQRLRDYYIFQIEDKIKGVKLNGSRKNRLPGNCNFSFENIDGEALLYNLDSFGIYASSGSACSTGSNNPSHVLKAIGLSDEMAYGTLRTTFGEDNTIDDVDFLITNLCEIIEKLRKTN